MNLFTIIYIVTYLEYTVQKNDKKNVEDGAALADKNKLPKLVKDFILSHHGHSVTEYFYNVYCNGGGDPKDKGLFTYKGELPSTKD